MADNGESGMNYDNIFIRMLSRVGDAMLLSILFGAFVRPDYYDRHSIYFALLYSDERNLR